MIKKNIFISSIFLLFGTTVLIYSCHKDEPAVDLTAGGFPNAVGKIILGKCATSGCHNDLSKEAAAGLSMETWDKLFEGGRGGACIIPYRPDFSTCMYYVNSPDFPKFGISLDPQMPFGRTALTQAEVKILNDWILEGAPNRDGYVKFSDNAFRKKIYITNQGCDVVAVIDESSKLVMRYINVGASPLVESPHMVKISPDGMYWYVVCLGGQYIQKYSAINDQFIGQAFIGSGSWNTFTITGDSKFAWIADWGSSNGKILYVNLQNMTLLGTFQGAWGNGHGTLISADSKTLYVGGNYSNKIYKTDVTNPLSPNENDILVSPNVNAHPHDMIYSPDQTKYYVTCEGTDEIRVMSVAMDTVLAIIPMGSHPKEMAVSTTHPYLFVTCEDDTTHFPGQGKKGSVAVINYLTDQLISFVDAGTFQPHGIGVDDVQGLIYVASRNIASNGPAPHHTSNCGGRDGYMTIIDINTLQRVPGYKPELSVDPYSIAVRH